MKLTSALHVRYTVWSQYATQLQLFYEPTLYYSNVATSCIQYLSISSSLADTKGLCAANSMLVSSSVRPFVLGEKKYTSGSEAKLKEPKNDKCLQPTAANMEGMTRVSKTQDFSADLDI